VVAAALTAAPVSAQVCTGFPTVDGQKAITANVGFPDGGKTYTLAGSVDLIGPFSINGGLGLSTIDGIDDKMYHAGANVAYELKGLGFSACPVVGLSYSRFKVEEEINDGGETIVGEATTSSFDVPLGFGIGQTFAAGSSAQFGLFAVPQVVISRTSAEFSAGGASFDASDTETYFGADIGALFQTGAFFAGGSVFVSSLEDSDPVFSVNLGMLIGRR